MFNDEIFYMIISGRKGTTRKKKFWKYIFISPLWKKFRAETDTPSYSRISCFTIYLSSTV